MLPRLGFKGRLLLIVVALLLGFLGLVIALSFMAQERRAAGSERFPVPAQVAAIVELLDATPKKDQSAVIRAVSNDRFKVEINAAPASPAFKRARLPSIEWLVSQYLETLPDRDVRVYAGSGQAASARGPLQRLVTSQKEILMQIALEDGRFATFQLRGQAALRVWGIPAGFWLGLIGCALAVAAMWAIVREARPLNELAGSVEAFSKDGIPRSVAAVGAPEIRRLIKSSNDMQDRIAELIKGRTMLLGAISHDLKTYVTRLRLRAEFIESEDQQSRAVRDLDDMTALIDTALSVARGSLTSDRRLPVDIQTLIREEADKRSDTAVTLAVQETADLPAVAGDPVALRQAISNLLDNAERYASRCEVAVRPWNSETDKQSDNDFIEIVVSDDGQGIPETDRDVIFEPFYRLDPSRSSSTGGAGLGLAITKQIIEAHGGTVHADQSHLGGAAFVVRLPLSGQQT